MKLLLYCLLGILCPMMNAFAQGNSQKPLSAGDAIPSNLVVTNVYNYPKSTIRLNDLKGRLVILDFWASWCGSCIKEFPKMEKLQAEFGDQLQIILVNIDSAEDKKKIDALLRRLRQKTGLDLTLPYALQNAGMRGYFPHKEIPHYVWISSEGIIKGITDAEALTATNIRAFINGRKEPLVTKKDELRFNPEKPLLVDENGGDDPSGFLYRSMFTGYKEYLGASINSRLSPDGKLVRYSCLNARLLLLLRFAYPEVFENYSRARTLVESKRFSEASILDSEEGEKSENRYCYEITLPVDQVKHKSLFMQQDIVRTFGLVASKGVEEMNCLVLQTLQPPTALRTSGGPSRLELEPDVPDKGMWNYPAARLANVLENRIGLPVIDETGIEFNLDIPFPPNFHTYKLEEVEQFLTSLNMRFGRAKRSIPVIRITDSQ